MSTLAKIFVVFNLVLTVVYFGSSATLYLNREDWRAHYMKIQSDYRETVKTMDGRFSTQKGQLNLIAQENSSLQTQVVGLTTRSKQQETELQSVKTKVNSMEQTVRQTADALDQAHKTIQVKEEKIQDKDNLIVGLQEKEQGARAAQEKAVSDVTRLMLDFSKLNDEHSQLLVRSSEQQDDLSKYEVIMQNLAAVGIDVDSFQMPHIQGVVEAVNDEDKLVVLSIGKDQKAQEGYELLVHRGPDYIAKVKVIRVYDDLSGARVLYAAPGKSVRVGDTVQTMRSTH